MSANFPRLPELLKAGFPCYHVGLRASPREEGLKERHMGSLAGSCPEAYAEFGPPRLRAGLVRRERLFGLLDLGAGRRLVVVKSPGGFGKTTLLADWLQARRRRYSWLGVEEGPLEGRELLALVAASLRSSLGEAGKALPEEGEGAGLVRAIAAAVGALDEPFSLVIDDCHLIGDRRAGLLLLRLAEALPPNASLVLSGRGEPSFPLARLRSRGELLEIGAAELRFTAAETRDFLRGPLGDSYSDDEAALLGAKTEGWVAALQMAVLGLRGRADRRAFLESFGGAHRDVFDYFAEETFAALDPGLLAFLLPCSVLETLSAPLCRELTGREDSAALVERLVDEGLFLLPLDDERRRYAFHGLFREALLRRLESDLPEALPKLRLAAAGWLAANGQPLEAMRLRLLAGDAEGAAALAEGRALSALESGRVEDLRSAIAVLPREAVESRPWLAVAAAWAAVYAGRLSDAAAFADAAEVRASAQSRIIGHVEAIRAYRANLEGDGEEAKLRALRAFELLPASDSMARAHAGKSLGFGFTLLHDYAAASRALEGAIEEAGSRGGHHIRVLAANDLAYLAMTQGRFSEAEEICRREIAAGSGGGREAPVLGCLHSLLSNICLSRGEIPAALEQARLGLEMGLAWGNMDRLVFSYVMYATNLAAAGDRPAARAALERLRALPDLTPRHAAVILMTAAEIDPAGPDAARMERMAPLKDENFNLSFQAVRARALLAKRRAAECLAVVLPSLELARRWNLRPVQLDALVNAALAQRSLGRREEARAAAAEARALAEELGDLLRIPARGPAIRSLLEEEGLLSGSFGARLAAAFDAFAERPGGDADDRSGEPLSPREREILSLLVQGRTAEEIASLLFVAPSTVRSHVKSLYAKLGVHRRIEAANKARELGIL